MDKVSVRIWKGRMCGAGTLLALLGAVAAFTTQSQDVRWTAIGMIGVGLALLVIGWGGAE